MNTNTFGNRGCEVSSAIAVGPHATSAERVGIKPSNRILAALPREVMLRLLPHLKPEFLPRGRVLCEVDESLRQRYFVERGLVSMGAVFADRATAEMATLGREGMLGIRSASGRRARPCPLCGADARTGSDHGDPPRAGREPGVLAACNGYGHAFLGEAPVDRSLQQRAYGRGTVRAPASDEPRPKQQRYHRRDPGIPRRHVGGMPINGDVAPVAGLIRYRRGAISVLNRRGLEAASCECYCIIREQYARLVPRCAVRQPFSRRLSLLEPYLPGSVGKT